MYFCINKTAELGAEILFLDSNTKLTPAISLYRKVGFKEIPVPEDTPYDRCNIRMQIKL
jgi:ribosomal protein S18 acetylase RimI-like enzyme